MSKITIRQNGKLPPFKIGDRVRPMNSDEVRTAAWGSKGATCRANQLIATDRHDRGNPYVDADIYFDARQPL